MTYQQTSKKLAQYRDRIAGLRQEMRKLQSAVEPQPVEDYRFATGDGEVRLSQLFGDKHDLFVIHNMGTSCPFCTLWADGFDGVYEQLANRAAFVVTSPDPPEVQRTFAARRGWRFPMASHDGTSFAGDMGYRGPDGGFRPGVSAFQKHAGRIVRVADQGLQPLDDFCMVWHLFDLLPEGAGGWMPKFDYA
jgi:predicted dithiol-disulfide oxidoreductase (DUF899 family)